jgi:hypothetical protein
MSIGRAAAKVGPARHLVTCLTDVPYRETNVRTSSSVPESRMRIGSFRMSVLPYVADFKRVPVGTLLS